MSDRTRFNIVWPAFSIFILLVAWPMSPTWSQLVDVGPGDPNKPWQLDVKEYPDPKNPNIPVAPAVTMTFPDKTHCEVWMAHRAAKINPVTGLTPDLGRGCHQ